MSPERASRIARGVVPSRCRSCKSKPEDALSGALPKADSTEGDIRWWIERYGGEIPHDVRPTIWVAQHGIPPELGELVASLTP